MELVMFETKDPAALRQLASRCRRLVRSISDEPAERALLGLAEEYERKAESLEMERVSCAVS
jgi:hypothetical protein